MLKKFGLSILAVFVVAVGLALSVLVIWPSYQDPQSRMYTSGLGYANLMRKLEKPFEVKSAPARKERMAVSILGEGVISGNPLRVPMIPLARIDKLHVDEGDTVTKGQLLVELDATEAKYNLESAKIQVTNAEAELERVRVGSAYVLARERPDQDKITLDAREADAELLKEHLETYERLQKKGVVGRLQVLEAKREYVAAEKKVEEAKLLSKMSNQGWVHSLRIAENALEDAKQNQYLREEELKNYKVYSPSDGVVSRILVREGEFNQDFGKPAMLLTTGMWFEGFFDQSAQTGIEEGQAAEVYLEAFPGTPFRAEVERIIPEVTFASGGPEITRPLRPRGTGAPEWAASFRVRLSFSGYHPRLALGMTGSVKVDAECESVVVPRNAVLSISAGRAIVLKPDRMGRGTFSPTTVKIGHVGDECIQIVDGLSPGEEVLVAGHRILRSGDRIALVQ